jgi:hypothetical protein
MNRFYLVNSDDEQEQEQTNIKMYLYVPFLYKDHAKNLGAKFDGDTKRWYTNDFNKNYQQLIDIFHKDNFQPNMIFPIKTEEQRRAQTIANKERYDELKNNWVRSYGGTFGFNKWYATNILKHE